MEASDAIAHCICSMLALPAAPAMATLMLSAAMITHIKLYRTIELCPQTMSTSNAAVLASASMPECMCCEADAASSLGAAERIRCWTGPRRQQDYDVLSSMSCISHVRGFRCSVRRHSCTRPVASRLRVSHVGPVASASHVEPHGHGHGPPPASISLQRWNPFRAVAALIKRLIRSLAALFGFKRGGPAEDGLRIETATGWKRTQGIVIRASPNADSEILEYFGYRSSPFYAVLEDEENGDEAVAAESSALAPITSAATPGPSDGQQRNITFLRRRDVRYIAEPGSARESQMEARMDFLRQLFETERSQALLKPPPRQSFPWESWFR
eukprot:6174570-Pleurochrysis_carterae.AAC.5